jgi:CRISPR-associated protein Csb2
MPLLDTKGVIQARLDNTDCDDKTVAMYTDGADTWATVTPVVLPGHYDSRFTMHKICTERNRERQAWLDLRRNDQTAQLLRKAIVQAGISPELARWANLEFNSNGFLNGSQHVSQYGVPKELKGYPVYHVRIAWKDAKGNPVRVPGPLCIGGGRFRGMGLMFPVRTVGHAQRCA